jgi:hypothetical protein
MLLAPEHSSFLRVFCCNTSKWHQKRRSNFSGFLKGKMKQQTNFFILLTVRQRTYRRTSGGVDDQLAERVNESHVDRREATDAAHVNGEVKTVRVWRFDKGAQRGSVSRTVDQLEELLVLETVYDAEESFACARWNQGF